MGSNPIPRIPRLDRTGTSGGDRRAPGRRASGDVICRRRDVLDGPVRSVETPSSALTGDLEVEVVDPRLPLAHAGEDARADGASVRNAGDAGDPTGRPEVANERRGLVLDATVGAADGGPVTVSTAERADAFVETFHVDGARRPGPDARVRPGEYGDGELFLAGALREYSGGALEPTAGRS